MHLQHHKPWKVFIFLHINPHYNHSSVNKVKIPLNVVTSGNATNTSFFIFLVLLFTKPFVVTYLWAGVSCCCDVKNSQAETETLMVYVTWISTVVSAAYGASLLLSHQSTGSITLLTLWSAAIVFQKCWTPTQVDGVISLGWFFSLKDISQMSLTVMGFMWADFIMLQESERASEWVGI